MVGVRDVVSFLYMWIFSFFSTIFLSWYLFTYICFWHFCQNFCGHSYVCLFLNSPFCFYILFFSYSWSLYLLCGRTLQFCFHVSVVNFDIRHCDSVIIVLSPQDFFGYSKYFLLSYNFRIFIFYFYKESYSNLYRDCIQHAYCLWQYSHLILFLPND